MSGNTFGTIFKLTTFGESHGEAIGAVIDGCPPNIPLTPSDIQNELDRRKPGQSKFVTQRKEQDIVQIISGVFEGKTTGTPMGFKIKIKNPKTTIISKISFVQVTLITRISKNMALEIIVVEEEQVQGRLQ